MGATVSIEVTHVVGGKHVKGISSRLSDGFQPMTGEVSPRVLLISKVKMRATTGLQSRPDIQRGVKAVKIGGGIRPVASARHSGLGGDFDAMLRVHHVWAKRYDHASIMMTSAGAALC